MGRLGRAPARPDRRSRRLVCLTPAGRDLVIRGLHHIAEIEAEWQERWREAGHDGTLRPVLERAVKDAERTRAAA